MSTAEKFAQGIRGHWGIENRLHWVKDVVFQEDNSKIRMSNAPANLSVMKAIAINILPSKWSYFHHNCSEISL